MTAVRWGPITPRASFWLALGYVVALAVPWMLVTPISGAPDEGAHMAKAAGVVRGQLVGQERAPGLHALQLPPLYGEIEDLNSCYAFRPTVSAACQEVPDDLSRQPTEVLTSAGRYHPLYYALVGLPTFLPPSMSALYAVRLAAALLAAATLAAAVRSVVEASRPRWLLGGLVAAVTPMVVFLSATVNPSTLEITAGIGLWTTLLVTLRAPRPDLVRRRMLRAGVLVALLVSAKASSPLYLALIVLTVVAASPWRVVRAVALDRRSWPGLGIGVLAASAAVGWVIAVGAVSRAGAPPHPHLTPAVATEQVLLRADPYLANMIGVFGRVDAGMPTWGYVLGGTLVLLPLVVALALGSRRERVVLTALALVVAALPLVLQVPQATHLGLPWQGRYALPVAVGLPLLAGFVVHAHRDDVTPRLSRGLCAVVALLWAVVQITGLVTASRRFTAGAAWPWLRAEDEPWAPPLAEPALLLAGAAVVLLGAVTVLRLSREVVPVGGAAAGGPPSSSRPGDEHAAAGRDLARPDPVLGGT